MSSLCSVSLQRHVAILSAAAVLALASASAQFAPSPNPTGSTTPPATESVSSSLQLVTDDGIAPEAALPSAPAASGSAAGQNSSYHSHSLFSHMTFAVGGGFNAPSSDSSNYVTWGGDFSLGAGFRFNPYLSLMTEYQFIDDKLPGKLIAETGANGGHAHIWSLTLEPVVDLMPKRTNDIYVTGGGGFYRKVTSFTDPMAAEFCDYYYCGIGVANVVVGHFSSNQGGWNVGGGFTHRVSGAYGESRMKLFAEARFLDVMSPASAIAPNGLGVAAVGQGTKLIPVSVGVRW
jgi:hypothetical protein